VEPEQTRQASFFWGLCDLLVEGAGTRKGVSSLLGLAQWFALLQRPVFSCFHHVYDFVRADEQKDIVRIPPAVVTELMVFLFLQPFVVGDIGMELSTELLACDAAPEFGFGVVHRSVSRALASQ